MAGCVRNLLGLSSYCFLACIDLNFFFNLCAQNEAEHNQSSKRKLIARVKSCFLGSVFVW